MNSIGIDAQGDIDPVVDEEARTIAITEQFSLFCQREEIPAAEILFSQLDRSHPSVQGLLKDPEEVPPQGLVAVRNEVHIEGWKGRSQGEF